MMSPSKYNIIQDAGPIQPYLSTPCAHRSGNWQGIRRGREKIIIIIIIRCFSKKTIKAVGPAFLKWLELGLDYVGCVVSLHAATVRRIWAVTRRWCVIALSEFAGLSISLQDEVTDSMASLSRWATRTMLHTPWNEVRSSLVDTIWVDWSFGPNPSSTGAFCSRNWTQGRFEASLVRGVFLSNCLWMDWC